MTQSSPPSTTFGITVGVLALQGAFSEHIQLLRDSAKPSKTQWTFTEVRTPEELERCDGLIIPGGESTTISLVAARSGLLEPLREFVKVKRLPTWGTCAGLILLSESANLTSAKAGGQELIGGLDVLINRNHFGRQVESFSADLDLPFLSSSAGLESTEGKKFQSVFIRAPVVEKILPHKSGAQEEGEGRVVAPSKTPADAAAEEAVSGEVEIMARLPGRAKAFAARKSDIGGIGNDVTADVGEEGDIIAVRQGNVFGTSFHPELTRDGRIHVWWLEEVEKATRRRRGGNI